MLRTPQFYVLYAMMLMIGIGGLMATAQVAPVARNFGVGAAALAIALSLNPLGNGASRFLWGWVSDSLGRERAMAVAFFMQALFLASVVTVGRRGNAWFVVTMALVFLTWGELYVLFPAVLADMFGAATPRRITASSTAPRASPPFWPEAWPPPLFEKTGTWDYAFYGSAALALCAALGALGLLRMPLPKKLALVEVALGDPAGRAEGGDGPLQSGVGRFRTGAFGGLLQDVAADIGQDLLPFVLAGEKVADLFEIGFELVRHGGSP